MERKNTVLLTVIAVATLLVAVVGATFAYFTATTTPTGAANGSTNANTVQVANAKITIGKVAGSENVVYPGTINYIGASIKSETEGSGENTFTSTYTVSGKITLSKQFKFDVDWELYEYTNATGFTAEQIISCPSVTTKTESGEVRYSQNCTKLLASAQKIKSGTISGHDVPTDTEEVVDISSEAKTINTGETKFYYLIVTYKLDDTQSQNIDMNKNIKLEMTGIDVTETAAKVG